MFCPDFVVYVFITLVVIYFKEIIEMEREVSPVIDFADATTKAICLYYWDADGDGELTATDYLILKRKLLCLI